MDQDMPLPSRKMVSQRIESYELMRRNPISKSPVLAKQSQDARSFEEMSESLGAKDLMLKRLTQHKPSYAVEAKIQESCRPKLVTSSPFVTRQRSKKMNLHVQNYAAKSSFPNAKGQGPEVPNPSKKSFWQTRRIPKGCSPRLVDTSSSVLNLSLEISCRCHRTLMPTCHVIATDFTAPLILDTLTERSVFCRRCPCATIQHLNKR